MTLKVTLSIHPGGDPSRARVVGEATISNVSELADVSDYRFELMEVAAPGGFGVSEKGVVVNHKRSDGPWRLVGRVLDEWRKKGTQ